MRKRSAIAVWAATLVVAGLAGNAWASHRWGCWKYADAAISFYNGCTGSYVAYANDEALNDSNAWSPYTDANLSTVGSAGSTDHMNIYNGSYGINGWLGIAEILSYSGCTILEGRVRMNESYLENASYGYTATNKKHVMCQEIGHLLGLDHNKGSKTTCMNDRRLDQPQPNSHDQSLVNSIY